MSGDPNSYFTIDTRSGEIRTATVVDYETTSSVLLNVQAQSGNPPTFGHAQVRSSQSQDELVHKLVHIMGQSNEMGFSFCRSALVSLISMTTHQPFHQIR